MKMLQDYHASHAEKTTTANSPILSNRELHINRESLPQKL
jgi:hypothetical protein